MDDKSPSSPSSPRTEITQLKDQLEAQAQQTRQALGQLMLVREQLISETNARIEAQVRWPTRYHLTLTLLTSFHSPFIDAHTAASATESWTARAFGLAGGLQWATERGADLSEHWHGAAGESPSNIIFFFLFFNNNEPLTGEFMWMKRMP